MSDSPDDIPPFAELAADPEIAPLLNFEPVPRKVKRPDGWTPELQRELVARIAHTGTLQAAVWQMGKHATGAEALYKVADARTFRLSWDAAIIIGRRRNGPNSRPPYAGPVPGIQRRNFSTIRDGGVFRNTVTTEDGDCPHCGGHAEPEWRRQQREREDQLRQVRRSLFMARRAYLSRSPATRSARRRGSCCAARPTGTRRAR